MKRFLLICLALFVMALPAAAEELNQPLIAEWYHAATDYPKIASWSLYWSDSPTAGFVKAADIDHPGDGPLESAEITLTVTGAAGATITKYFFMTAWARIDGKETGPSNVAPFEFAIPYPPVQAPSQFTIRVKIQPQ